MDGGHIALAGFFLQLSHTLGYALSDTTLNLAPGAPDDCDGGLRSAVWAEAAGQDAAVTAGQLVNLIQFKFSRVGRTISAAELKKVAAKLETDWNALPSDKRGSRTLQTNRELSAGARKAWADAKKKWRSGKGPMKWRVLGSLEIKSVDANAWRKHVFDAAAAFGATEQEALDAGKSWLGTLLADIAGGGPAHVDPRDFLEVLVGTRSAKTLVSDRVRNETTAAAEQFRRTASVEPLAPVLRTESLDAISRLIEQHAIVLVMGEGGCGKTVILAELILSRCESSGPNGAFSFVAHVSDVREKHVVRAALQWVGLIEDVRTYIPSSDSAVQRVRRANSTLGHPVLCMALDGLDETKDVERDNVLQLIRWFATEERQCRESGGSPRASLVISCRAAREYELIAPYALLTDATVPPPRGQFTLGYFSDDEFSRAVETQGGPLKELWADIRRAEARAGERGHSITSDARPASVQWLQHPVILGIFSSQDADTQRKFLEGDSAATDLIVKRFVVWCAAKCQRRDPASGMSSDQVVRAWAAVASKAPNEGSLQSYSLWVATIGELQMGGANIDLLWRTALTSGLLVTDGDSDVRWRDGRVADWLSRQHGAPGVVAAAAQPVTAPSATT